MKWSWKRVWEFSVGAILIEVGIAQEFSTQITHQQNWVVERKNQVIQEMARAIMHNKDVAKNL